MLCTRNTRGGLGRMRRGPVSSACTVMIDTSAADVPTVPYLRKSKTTFTKTVDRWKG